MARYFSSFILLLAMVPALTCACDSKVTHYEVEVLEEYNHDTNSYTQGLFFHEGRMYESTGQYGKSTFREVDLSTGRALRKVEFDKKYFVEGSCIFNDALYILTWENKEVFKYDPSTLEPIARARYPRQGWGLTTDGEQLIASDGSAYLFFMDGDLKLKRKVLVTLDERPVRWLNELEYVDGMVWANVYMTDDIVIINPKDGKVHGVISCKGLLPRKLQKPDTDVLNGIAFNPADGSLYLTGKNWPRLYKVKIVKKNK